MNKSRRKTLVKNPHTGRLLDEADASSGEISRSGNDQLLWVKFLPSLTSVIVVLQMKVIPLFKAPSEPALSLWFARKHWKHNEKIIYNCSL